MYPEQTTARRVFAEQGQRARAERDARDAASPVIYSYTFHGPVKRVVHREVWLVPSFETPQFDSAAAVPLCERWIPGVLTLVIRLQHTEKNKRQKLE